MKDCKKTAGVLAVVVFTVLLYALAAFGGEAIGGTDTDLQVMEKRYEQEEMTEEPQEPVRQQVDLMIFAGQSNMAGNGDAELAPEVVPGAGYEFRAISDPTMLFPIEEPFGMEENKEDGIYDIWPDSGIRRKLGDLVPAFVNAYYETTGVPVVGVSASEGGTIIEQWLPGTPRYEDLKERTRLAKEYLEASEDYELRHTYLVWCQGESNGDNKSTEEAYYEAMEQLVSVMTSEGIVEKCMVIRIGNFGADAKRYDAVIAAQTRVCREHPDAVLISTRFAEMADTGQMRDVYHYTQEGYNLAGQEAGENCGFYSNTGKEPELYDYEYKETYLPFP